MFFFFKQKTAYEMRISDWSSDVCSSDLPVPAIAEVDRGDEGIEVARIIGEIEPRRPFLIVGRIGALRDLLQLVIGGIEQLRGRRGEGACLVDAELQRAVPEVEFQRYAIRSEEHTSELQSLLRTSYAVFCL